MDEFSREMVAETDFRCVLLELSLLFCCASAVEGRRGRTEAGDEKGIEGEPSVLSDQ